MTESTLFYGCLEVGMNFIKNSTTLFWLKLVSLNWTDQITVTMWRLNTRQPDSSENQTCKLFGFWMVSLNKWLVLNLVQAVFKKLYLYSKQSGLVQWVGGLFVVLQSMIACFNSLNLKCINEWTMLILNLCPWYP